MFEPATIDTQPCGLALTKLTMIASCLLAIWSAGCDLGEAEMKLRSDAGGDGEHCPEPGSGSECVCSRADSDADAVADSEVRQDTDEDGRPGTDEDVRPDTALQVDSDVDSDTGVDSDTDTDTGAHGGADTDMDAGSVADSGPDRGPGCLVISEYVEGSSNNKGVELYNCGVEELDLATYSICCVTNDATACSSTVHLEGSLDTGQVITVCHTSADAIARCDLRSGVMSFNGDDRLAVQENGETVDALGELAVRPAETPWKDVTLRRCNLEPFSGDTAFEHSEYYTTHEKDDFSHFGVAPSMDPCVEQ